MVRLLLVCWGRLTVTMVISQLTVVLVLGVCVRMLGLDQATISWAVILVAWGAVTFASLLIPTPGGLGVAEVVLVGVLGHGLPESDQRRCWRPSCSTASRRSSCRSHRAGHLPVLAPVDRVAPTGELPRPERP